MHTKPMNENEGVFEDEKIVFWFCPNCKQERALSKQVWESSCGGYEDHKYRCMECGHSWWVDGIDS
jgi:DNA-directed RNA polymerase subunit M/transcription elongation factor TFIIS